MAHLFTTSSSQATYPSHLRFCVGAHSFRCSSSSPKRRRFGDPFGGGGILNRSSRPALSEVRVAGGDLCRRQKHRPRRQPRKNRCKDYEKRKGLSMPIYHLEAKVISRGTGRSAVAASAYMSCSKILNDYDGVQHDYTRKQGLVWEQVFIPENAPAEWKNRANL